LQVFPDELSSAPHAFEGIKELELDDIYLSWKGLCLLTQQFASLTTLTASSNGYSKLSVSEPILAPNLTSLTLEYNEFTSLSDLCPLDGITSLETLRLKGNQISRIAQGSLEAMPIFHERLHYVDLSYNAVTTWDFVDELATFLPGLRALRFSHNPVYEGVAKEGGSATSVEEGYMLTLARIGNLKTLNFSNITGVERTNAEMFYLSRIGKAMAEVPESEEHTITSQHKRYAELCEIYGPPTVVRKGVETINPNFLEARLIKFTFYMPPKTLDDQEDTITKTQEIPKGFDIYRVKGTVGKLFGVRPLSMRLIWETGEWDPVAGYEAEEEDSSDHENGQEKTVDAETVDAETAARRERGKWMRREVELKDGTRQVGFCVDGMEVKVRIEMR